MRRSKKFSGSNAGFTLVELAVVMIIIGLLIGGILKGQELILNARIKSTVQHIDAFRSAILTFQDSYGALPGDLSNPSTKLPGCATTPSCLAMGGNQDGYIGTPKVGNWSRDDQSALTSEPTQAWIQLKLADLLSGITGDTMQDWGAAYPASPLGGGFQIVNAAESGNNQAFGHYFLLRLNPTGDPHPTAPGLAELSPSMLARIDRQFDDGLPNTGTIIADNAGSQCWNTGTVQYQGNNEDKICFAAFRF